MAGTRYEQADILALLEIPIVDILSHVGFSDKHRGDMYYSPFRQESTPSFHINHRCNIWYDHGAGVGGGVLDLVRLLLKCTVRDAFDYLASIKGLIPESVVYNRKKEVKEPVINIIKVNPQIQNETLLRYARSRAIGRDILNKYCQEVTFEIKGMSNRIFHAIGFPNCEGGYVLRSTKHKKCTCNAPTWIDSHDKISMTRTADKLYIFEGFMDFLSWKVLDEFSFDNYDCCVLNSVNNLSKILPKITEYKSVKTFLDNDEAGLKAFSQLAQALEMTDVSISEMAGLYDFYKDLNEMLVATRLFGKTL